MTVLPETVTLWETDIGETSVLALQQRLEARCAERKFAIRPHWEQSYVTM